jgi:hypothetical protein
MAKRIYQQRPDVVSNMSTTAIHRTRASDSAGGRVIVMECLPQQQALQGVPAAGKCPARLQLLLRVRAKPTGPAGASETPGLSRLFHSHQGLMASLSPSPLPDRRLYAVVNEGAKDQAHEWLASLKVETVPASASFESLDLNEVAEHRCEVRAGNRWVRTLTVAACSRPNFGDWLSDLVTLRSDIDLSLHLQGPAATFLLNLWAGDRSQLTALSQRAEDILAGHGFEVRRPYFEAEQAFRATLPFGVDHPGPGRLPAAEMVTSWVEAGRPRSERLYGVDPGTRTPVCLDRIELGNATQVILAGEESRRTQVAIELMRARLMGISTHLIDPSSEYVQLVQALGGQVIEIGPGQPAPFDPFAVCSGIAGALGSRIASLLTVIEVLAGSLSNSQRQAVDDALTLAFASHGHTNDAQPPGPSTPDLKQVAAILKQNGSREVQSLGERLDEYAAGPGLWLFGRRHMPASISPLVAYALAGVPSGKRAVAILMCLAEIRAHSQASVSRGLVVVDQVEHLAGSEPAAQSAVDLASSNGLALTLASSDLPAVLGSPLREMVARSGVTILMRPNPGVMPDLAQLFHLTPPEQSWLRDTRAGEGLLITEGRRLPFETVMSKEERQLIHGGIR